MNENKCPYCGGFLPQQALYFYRRPQGTLYVWVCPNCRNQVKKWVSI